MSKKKNMSFATMLVMGLTATNSKIQFKGLVRKSQNYIRKKNTGDFSKISSIKFIQYSNLALEKANKTAFQLSNYLTVNKMFGSLRARMLQHPSTRLFEYAFKAKFIASQESTSLIYPRAHMYSILEQEARATYKGKSTFPQISFIFLWVSGFVALFNAWPFFKTHPFNKCFVPETFISRKKSILSDFDRQIENVWDKQFSFLLYKKTKIHSNLLNLFSIISVKKNISFNLLTSIKTNHISQINNKNYKMNKKELKSYLKVSKEFLNNYKLKAKVKQIKLTFINLSFINYWDQLLNSDMLIDIKRILSFSQKFTQQIVMTAKFIFNKIGNFVSAIEIFIINKENIIIQFLLVKIDSLLQIFSHILNKLIRPYNIAIQNVSLSWKNHFQKLQQTIHFRLIKIFSPINQIEEVILKISFWKTKGVKKNIKLKEQIENIFNIFKHGGLIYLTRMNFIYVYIKKNIIFKNKNSKQLKASFQFNLKLNDVTKKIDKNKFYAIDDRPDYKNKVLRSTSKIKNINDNRYLFQCYYSKVRLEIKNINKKIFKYLQTVFFILINHFLQNLRVIAFLIKQEKKKQIAFYIENFFENEKKKHCLIKLNRKLFVILNKIL